MSILAGFCRGIAGHRCLRQCCWFGRISAGDGQSYSIKNGSQFRLIPANQVSNKTYPGTVKQRVIFRDSVAGLRNYYLQRIPQLANVQN